MITQPQMLAALKYLSDTGNLRATEGQALTWTDLLATAVPDAQMPDLQAGVRAYAATTANSWTTAADVIPHIRAAYLTRMTPPKCAACDEHRHIETDQGQRRCPTCHPLAQTTLTTTKGNPHGQR